MARKNLDWDDIYNYIQVAPKDKCIAMVELINRKYGWEDGVPEKTLDDFTMAEILKYARAYTGKSKKVEKRNMEDDISNMLCKDVTFEMFKSYMKSKSDGKTHTNDIIKICNSKTAREITKLLSLSDEYIEHIYNQMLSDTHQHRTLTYFYHAIHLTTMVNMFNRLSKDNGYLTKVYKIIANKHNHLDPFIYQRKSSNYTKVTNEDPSLPYTSMMKLLMMELKHNLKYTNKFEPIVYNFKHDPSKVLTKTTLERLVDIFGLSGINSLLLNMGFDNIDYSVIHDPDFICNFTAISKDAKKIPNKFTLPQYTRSTNEIKDLWLQHRFKIYDVYGEFISRVADLVANYNKKEIINIVQVFIDAGLFGNLSIYQRVAQRTSDLLDPELQKCIHLAAKHNNAISRSNLISERDLKLSRIQWYHVPRSVKLKNPQTVIHQLLKLGITNKQIQKLAECTSLEVIAAAKDDDIWINDITNWKKGALKDLCELSIKRSIHYLRLEQILVSVEKNKIYQYYHQLIKSDPSLLDGLTYRKLK